MSVVNFVKPTFPKGLLTIALSIAISHYFGGLFGLSLLTARLWAPSSTAVDGALRAPPPLRDAAQAVRPQCFNDYIPALLASLVTAYVLSCIAGAVLARYRTGKPDSR